MQRIVGNNPSPCAHGRTPGFLPRPPKRGRVSAALVLGSTEGAKKPTAQTKPGNNGRGVIRQHLSSPQATHNVLGEVLKTTRQNKGRRQMPKVFLGHKPPACFYTVAGHQAPHRHCRGRPNPFGRPRDDLEPPASRVTSSS